MMAWQKAEEVFMKHCLNEGWFCQKLTDTSAAGVVVDSQLADFVIAKDFFQFFVEVKFSVYDSFPLKNLRDRKEQTARILSASNRGVPILYALFTVKPDIRQMSLYPSFSVLERVYAGELTIAPNKLYLSCYSPKELREAIVDARTDIRPKQKKKKGVVYAPIDLR